MKSYRVTLSYFFYNLFGIRTFEIRTIIVSGFDRSEAKHEAKQRIYRYGGDGITDLMLHRCREV